MRLQSSVIQGYGSIPITYTLSSRDQLPYLVPPNQTFSIWSILKDAIGKDLSKITMPIQLNEPISMLQKTAESMHYSQVMDKAMAEKNDIKRLTMIACFVLTQYADVIGRTRKPFNPILGETYELVTPNFRFISE